MESQEERKTTRTRTPAKVLYLLCPPPRQQGEYQKVQQVGVGNSSCACMHARIKHDYVVEYHTTYISYVRASLLFFAHLLDDERIPPSRP